jgi:hypothetical protein
MSIEVELVAWLEQLRELYIKPRNFERFKKYLAMVQTQTGEMALPISNVNPMAKPHVLERVEALLAFGAESVALDAARAAAARLGRANDALRLVVILADDAMGGWTNHAFTEFAHRYERRHEVDRGWASVLLWSSEEPTRELVAQRTEETLYRTLDERRNGAVQTLGAILEREGRTMRFAGHKRRHDDATVALVRETLQPYLDSRAAPKVFAALYGDDIARSLGYPPLGVPDRGGYELALAGSENAAAAQ